MAAISTIRLLVNIIPIGCTTALYVLTSLFTLALYFSYCVPETLTLLRKTENDFPAYGSWKIAGPFWVGLTINTFAFFWNWYSVFSLSLPTFMPVTAVTMNWVGSFWREPLCLH